MENLLLDFVVQLTGQIEFFVHNYIYLPVVRVVIGYWGIFAFLLLFAAVYETFFNKEAGRIMSRKIFAFEKHVGDGIERNMDESRDRREKRRERFNSRSRGSGRVNW